MADAKGYRVCLIAGAGALPSSTCYSAILRSGARVEQAAHFLAPILAFFLVLKPSSQQKARQVCLYAGRAMSMGCSQVCYWHSTEPIS
jgi:hypothetical protein